MPLCSFRNDFSFSVLVIKEHKNSDEKKNPAIFCLHYMVGRVRRFKAKYEYIVVVASRQVSAFFLFGGPEKKRKDNNNSALKFV